MTSISTVQQDLLIQQQLLQQQLLQTQATQAASAAELANKTSPSQTGNSATPAPSVTIGQSASVSGAVASALSQIGQTEDASASAIPGNAVEQAVEGYGG